MKKNPFLYYGKKLLIFVLSVVILSVAVFYISRLAPGDPLMSYYGERVEKMTVEEKETAQWNFLRAEALFSLQQYESAAACYEKAQQTQDVYARLEACYRELGDYKRAYEYACKQK